MIPGIAWSPYLYNISYVAWRSSSLWKGPGTHQSHQSTHILDKRQLLSPLVHLLSRFQSTQSGIKIIRQSKQLLENTRKSQREIAAPDSACHELAARLISWFDSRTPGGLMSVFCFPSHPCLSWVFFFSLRAPTVTLDEYLALQNK